MPTTKWWGRGMAVVLLGSLLLGPACVWAAGPKDDSFEGASLDPKWTVTALGNSQKQEYSAAVENGELALVAGGSDIWDAADNGLYVWQAATGDFRVTLKLLRLDETDASSKVGIWVREDMDPAAPNVFAQAMPKGVNFQGRTTRGGTSAPGSGCPGDNCNEWPGRGDGSEPIWVRVTRNGDLFNMELSYDNVEWIPAKKEGLDANNRITAKMASTVLIGIGLTSHNTGQVANAAVDDFVFEQLSGGPPDTQGYIVPAIVDADGNVQTGSVRISRDGKVIGTGSSGKPFLVDAGPLSISIGGQFVAPASQEATVTAGKTSFAKVTSTVVRTLVKDLTTAAGQSWKMLLPTAVDEDYRAPNASEADFAEVTVPSNEWDAVDPTDNIYGWYRTTVAVPAEFVGKDLYLVDYMLDDEDWTYWNGQLIGHLNSWNTQRVYFIPGNLVQASNVLAIQGRDGTGGGGIYDNAAIRPKLVVGNPSGSVVGFVKTSGGEPLAGVPVTASADMTDWGPMTVTATTAADGSYRISPLGPGSYSVTISAPTVIWDNAPKSFAIAGGASMAADFTASFVPLQPDPVTVADDFAAAALNPRWKVADLGGADNTDAGSARIVNGEIEIEAGGADFWDTMDRGTWVYLDQKFTGDFTVTAKVNSVPDTDAWSKATIMVRKTADPGSPMAFVANTRDNGLDLQYRLTADAAALNKGGTARAFAPATLRLDRQGSVMRGYWSPDGKQVFFLGEQEIPELAGEVMVGLAVTSHSAGNPGTATFDDFAIGGIPAGEAIGPASGDLNGDGKINVQDATLSLRIAVGLLTPTDAQKAAGDVNNDNKLNIQDTTLILQVAVGNKPASDLK